MTHIKLATLTLAAVATVAMAGGGLASADSIKTTVGNSGISRTTLRQDRQQAAAKVLNTSTNAIKTAHENKTMSDLVTKAGLDKATYHEKVKAELMSELKSQGYSQDQIDKALQHKHHAHVRHSK